MKCISLSYMMLSFLFFTAFYDQHEQFFNSLWFSLRYVWPCFPIDNFSTILSLNTGMDCFKQLKGYHLEMLEWSKVSKIHHTVRIWLWMELIVKFYSSLNGTGNKWAHSLILLAALNGTEIIWLWSSYFYMCYDSLPVLLILMFTYWILDSLVKQQKKWETMLKVFLNVMVTSHGQTLFQWTFLILIQKTQ